MTEVIRYKDTPAGIASKKWKEANKHTPKYRHQRFVHQTKHVYSINEKEYSDILDRQKGACAIRNDPLHHANETRRPRIDHCHNTGKIRGLLCHKCNTGLGLLNENIETLKNAIKYLEGYYGLAS